MSDGLLPFDAPEPAAVVRSDASALPDQAARDFAVNPGENVVLEASAGTGKTRVLVERYVNLLLAGIDPDNILAITFTRKAAAEMRQRIIDRLREASRTSQLDAARWRDLRDRLGDIAISTIDAFCLALLREFPLEADVDPGFELADETEVPRLTAEALDSALRICRAVAEDDDDVALVFAQLGERRLRAGLAALLDRRLVAPHALGRYLANGPRDLTARVACERAAERLRDAVAAVAGGVAAFVADGPCGDPAFAMLADDLRTLSATVPSLEDRRSQALFRGVIDRLRAYFLKQDGDPRGDKFAGTGFTGDDCVSPAAWKRHRAAAAGIAPAIAEAIRGFRRDLNAVQSRGVWRIFAVALTQYQKTLEAHALLDFSGVLERTIDLLKQMEEFARSRYRLESRYQHVLVDEFQDTSRAQWELVAQLVRSWGEGLGVAASVMPPSIFVVGDRKQSIYGFRDADVAVIDEAAAFIQQLRGDQSPRRAISVSFRSAPALLAFVNDVFDAIEQQPGRRDGFRFQQDDRFPLVTTEQTNEPRIGMVAGATVAECADHVADEIVRLLSGTTVRDRATGVARDAVASDIAILFRSRESHREFESALARRGVASYVYKGLGFFEADEIQDIVSVLRFLADPASDIRAAALLRSRVVRLSDVAIAALAPAFAAAATGRARPEAVALLPDEDRRVLDHAAASIVRWLSLVDRVTPAELVDLVLAESAYAFELRGPRRLQARENVKKLRAMIRRVQNRGYATLARIADHLERLAVGDESNAAIDAAGAVSLMTVHAAKGLEFPIVFLVNVGRGTGNSRAPIRVATTPGGEPSVAVADYESEADEDARARDREETKRLLYVALTRARDRLYLGTTVKDGAARTGVGSLAEVLPKTFVALFPQAASAPGCELTWTAPSGDVHRIAVPAACDQPLTVVPAAAAAATSDDLAPIVSGSTKRMSVVAHVSSRAAGPARTSTESSDAAIGTLAHRLFSIGGDRDRLRTRAAAWAGDAGISLDRDTIERAIDAALALRADPRVAPLLGTGRPRFEVPFSFRADDGTVLRGSIDCLVRQPGRTTIVELKTGAPRPQHDAQLALYVAAARAIFAGDEIEGLLVYTG